MERINRLANITLSRLTYPLSGQFITRNYDDVIAAKLDLSKDVYLKGLVDSLNILSDDFNSHLFKDKKDKLTDPLSNLDYIRDQCYRTLSKQLNVFSTNVKDPQKKASYDVLKLVFKKYRALDRMNYELETKAIVNLMLDLKLPENAQHITKLGLQEYITDLEAANKDFTNLYATRDVSKKIVQSEDTRAARELMFEKYNEYVYYVFGLSNNKSHPEAALYNRLLEIINIIRDHFDKLSGGTKGEGTGDDNTPQNPTA